MTVTREMPRYQCHKKVWALKIKEVIKHAHPDPKADDEAFEASEAFQGAHLMPEDTGFAPIPVDAAWYRKHNPQTGGYYVVYEDGYTSYSPAEAFESGYTLEADRSSRMNFGQALQAMKAGQKMSRSGWNGKGMFVYLVPAASYPVQAGAAKSHFGEGAMVPYNAYMAIKNVDNTVSTWVPSVNDCLADDWGIAGGEANQEPEKPKYTIYDIAGYEVASYGDLFIANFKNGMRVEVSNKGGGTLQDRMQAAVNVANGQ